jgi:Dienelactone hydrolase family
MSPTNLVQEVRTDLGLREVIVVRPKTPSTNDRPVLLLHEITGLSPACLHFAERLAERGSFVVYMPRMFGRTNEDSTWAVVRNFVRVIVDPDWWVLRSGHTPAAYREMPALVEKISAENHAADVGVIGMCLTGSWPLALLAEPRVKIGALCQPAVPLPAWTEKRRRDLALSETNLRAAGERIQRDQLTVLGFRFCGDGKSTPERFWRVADLCGTRGRFVDGTICYSNYHGAVAADAHSVFCGDYLDDTNHPTRQRLDLLISEFRQALNSGPTSTGSVP